MDEDTIVWAPLDLNLSLAEPAVDEPLAAMEPAWKAGQRVAFTTDVMAQFGYENPPTPGESGTVVAVRSSTGSRTAYAGQVFVAWDGGGFGPVASAHLRPQLSSRRSASYRKVVTAMDLRDFMRVAGTNSDLVHKATRDLWNLTEVDGEFVIERLFDETGSPLKV